MAKEIFIPQLGQTVEEVTLVRWLVSDGAKVEPGDEILEVETDKSLFTIEANAGGYVHLGPYKEDDTIAVLTVVGIIGKADDKFVSGESKAAQAIGAAESAQGRDDKVFASPRARQLAAAQGVDLALVKPTGGGGQRVAERDVKDFLHQMSKVTPLAQRVAAEEGVDLRAVAGSGPRGKITKKDVERAKAPAGPPPAAVSPSGLPEEEVFERVPLKGVRGLIAERMANSVHTTARVTLLMEADATEFVTMRERLKAQVADEWGFAPGYTDLLAKIAAMALRRFPYMNARLTPDAIERLAHVNLGLATDTERGLLAPVVRDADKKSLRQFGTEFRELVERARTGKSLPDDLSGGTFTLTNLGMYDVLAFTPVINLPEAAILGVGCITPQVVARDGQVEVRQMLILSLVFDHRLVDGAPAARFLQYIKDLIEEPYLWLAAQP